MKRQMIYLDNAATTKIAPEVLDSMMPYLTENFGNPSSVHFLGQEAKKAIEKAREQVANFLYCQPENIIFTSGGSEGNSFVASQIPRLLSNLDCGFDLTHMVTTETEHHSLRQALHNHTKDGFGLSFASPNHNRVVTLEKILPHITKKTGFVSVMHTNNELGMENEVWEIGEWCEAEGIKFHTDCVQGAGNTPLFLGISSVDFATISSHKIHGPKGVGAVYVNSFEEVDPIIFGGNEQEFGLRGGTENVAGIVGFGMACELAQKSPKKEYLPANEAFLSGLVEFGLTRTAINNGGKIVNLMIDKVLGETLVFMMSSRGVCISAGSACNSRQDIPSETLLAYGFTEKQARSSVRISFSRYNTPEEGREAARILTECVDSLRRMGFYMGS